MSNLDVWPIYHTVTTAAPGTVAVFEVNGKREEYPVILWAVRRRRDPADDYGPEIRYTGVVGLLSVEGYSELEPVDGTAFAGRFVEYLTP